MNKLLKNLCAIVITIALSFSICSIAFADGPTPPPPTTPKPPTTFSMLGGH